MLAERLRYCARDGALRRQGVAGHASPVIRLLPGEKIDWEGVCLQEKVEGLERAWITRALAEAEGAPTKAARLLGLPTP